MEGREIRISEKGDELYFSFWVGGEKVSFKELGEEDQNSFLQMIHSFSQYFSNIASVSEVQIFYPN